MKQKKPKHCKGCKYHHNAGHPKGSALYASSYNNWCCKFGKAAPKAATMCVAQGAKQEHTASRAEREGLR